MLVARLKRSLFCSCFECTLSLSDMKLAFYINIFIRSVWRGKGLSSEVWGIDCNGKLERDQAELVQNKFQKWLLGVN